MAGWSGFSDADLRAIKGETNSELENGVPASQKHRQAASTRGKPISKRLQYQPAVAQSVPQQAMLSKPQSKLQQNNDQSKRMTKRNGAGDQKDITGPGITPVDAPTETDLKNDKTAASGEGVSNNDEDVSADKKTKDDLVDNEEEILSREIENLEIFRKHQKKIEDLNIKKKQALAVAIQQRQKQAKAETTRLLAIQKELAKLDQMVNNDVSLIRDKIEESSRDFLEAQKRYDRAEKEFIEAKMELHRKEETKENLTDHLYAIIHQNEVRKAKKLAELMDKLNMEDEETTNELSEMSNIELPHLTVINPVILPRQKRHSHSDSEQPPEDGASESKSVKEEASEKVPNLDKSENVSVEKDEIGSGVSDTSAKERTTEEPAKVKNTEDHDTIKNKDQS